MESRNETSNPAIVWMEELISAWLSLDVDKAVELFTDCTEYGEDPFQDPLVSAEQVKQVWQEIRTQSHLDINLRLLSWTGQIATIQWHARFRIGESAIKQFDGVYVVHFNSLGRCCKFQQWWNEGPEIIP